MSLNIKLAMLATVAVLSTPAMAWESANDGGRLRHFTNTIDLNMRAWPAPVSQIVATLPSGSQMSADRCIHPAGLQDDWCHVVSASSTGWVDAAYLQETGQGAAAAAPAKPDAALLTAQAAADAAAAARAKAEAARLEAEAKAAQAQKEALEAKAAADAAAAARANVEATRLTAEAKAKDAQAAADAAAAARANAEAARLTAEAKAKGAQAAADAAAAARAKAEADRLAAGIKVKGLIKEADDAAEWGRKVAEARAKGTEYAETIGSKWSLSEIDNPMIDDKDYSVTSVQLNGKGAVAKIEGTCRSPGQVTFVATFGDNEDPNSPLGLPDFAAGYIAGNKRINGDAAFPTRFQSQKFRNTILLATLTSQHTADSIETTWRVLATIETARGRLLMQIPTFDANVQKLLVACRKQYDNAQSRGGLVDAPT